VEPDVLVLDEPSTLLDLRNRELLRRTLAGLRQQIVMSTHDLELALDMDRVLVVESGRIAYDGAAAAAVAHYRALCADSLEVPRGRNVASSVDPSGEDAR
jgi:biotin transport system ATP-binding protein